MAKIVVLGVGEIADLAHYYFTNDTEHEVVAFTLDKEYIQDSTFKGLPIVDFEDVEKTYPPEDYQMFVAIGYKRVNKAREEKYSQAKGKGYSLESYISSRANVFDNVTIGDNCFVLEDNTLQPFCRVGNNVVAWSGNHIGHHSRIEDHCFITSHVVISGGVVVEPYCFLGVNATIRDHITIARENVIGAGCLITRDTQPREVYVGDFSKPSKVPSNRLKNI
ncbi:MAG: acetyltransferase [Nitrospinae bacterium]|nr:acetyltransferase [Nitrospinota bacterium]